MGDPPHEKRVDETWKDQVEEERRRLQAAADAPRPPREERRQEPAARQPRPSQEPAEVRLDLFISDLSIQALAALGEIPHPVTQQRELHLPQAKYLIDLLGLLSEKTQGNLSPEEDQLLSETLYQLRLRYAQKATPAAAGGVTSQPTMPPP